MSIEDLVELLIEVEGGPMRISIRIEHEDVFAYYDPESIEFDPLTNELYITTKDTRSLNQKYVDDSDTITQPILPIKRSANTPSTNNN